MKKFVSILTVVGLLFSLSIGIIYADAKDVPEGGKIYLQYGHASAKDTVENQYDENYKAYWYKTSGTCTNSQAVLSVYVRDHNRKVLSQSSCSGLNKTTETRLKRTYKIDHIHTASSVIPQ